MSASPPPSDRDLSVDIVRRVMSEQFYHLALHTIEYLDSGHEYDAFVIDGDLLVRFPRYADVAHGLLDFLCRVRALGLAGARCFGATLR